MGIEQHAKRSRVVDLPRGMDLLQYLGWRNHPIAQCNNVFIFPAMVLGVVGSGARRITDSMMLAAARALADNSPAIKDPSGSLLPPLTDLRRVAVEIAVAVGRAIGVTSTAVLCAAVAASARPASDCRPLSATTVTRLATAAPKGGVIGYDLNQRPHLRDSLGIPNHTRDRCTRWIRSSADRCRRQHKRQEYDRNLGS